MVTSELCKLKFTYLVGRLLRSSSAQKKSAENADFLNLKSRSGLLRIHLLVLTLLC
jgi:hypothetical protein